MLAFLLHLLIENFKRESYCLERNNWELILKGYDFELYQTTFRNKNFNRLFNSTALFVISKWPLTIQVVVNKSNRIKLKCLKFSFLNSVAFCVMTQVKVDLQLHSFLGSQ